MASTNQVGEIEIEEEATPLLSSSSTIPKPTHQRSRSVRTLVPEAEVHVYRQGEGPIDVIKMGLSGWDQDQLEVREILNRFGFKSVYAFTPGSGRGAPLAFNPRNGRSLITYKDGALIHVDGEPKDSIVKPITKILVGVVVMTIVIVMVVSFTNDTPKWAKKLNFSGFKIPPWVLACAVIMFMRLRKRTMSLIEKYIH